jgi:hypothetical protein
LFLLTIIELYSKEIQIVLTSEINSNSIDIYGFHLKTYHLLIEEAKTFIENFHKDNKKYDEEEFEKISLEKSKEISTEMKNENLSVVVHSIIKQYNKNKNLSFLKVFLLNSVLLNRLPLNLRSYLIKGEKNKEITKSLEDIYDEMLHYPLFHHDNIVDLFNNRLFYVLLSKLVENKEIKEKEFGLDEEGTQLLNQSWKIIQNETDLKEEFFPLKDDFKDIKIEIIIPEETKITKIGNLKFDYNEPIIGDITKDLKENNLLEDITGKTPKIFEEKYWNNSNDYDDGVKEIESHQNRFYSSNDEKENYVIILLRNTKRGSKISHKKLFEILKEESSNPKITEKEFDQILKATYQGELYFYIESYDKKVSISSTDSGERRLKRYNEKLSKNQDKHKMGYPAFIEKYSLSQQGTKVIKRDLVRTKLKANSESDKLKEIEAEIK